MVSTNMMHHKHSVHLQGVPKMGILSTDNLVMVSCRKACYWIVCQFLSEVLVFCVHKKCKTCTQDIMLHSDKMRYHEGTVINKTIIWAKLTRRVIAAVLPLWKSV